MNFNKSQLQQLKEAIAFQITMLEFERENLSDVRKWHRDQSDRDVPETKGYHDTMKRYGNQLSSCVKKLDKLRALQKQIKNGLMLTNSPEREDTRPVPKLVTSIFQAARGD